MKKYRIFTGMLIGMICLTGCVGQEKVLRYDLIPMVRVDGEQYLDTGMKSMDRKTCKAPDGKITAQVDGSEAPTMDDQSNFGMGYPYRYGAIAGTVEIYMKDDWYIFATEEVKERILFPEKEDITQLLR